MSLGREWLSKWETYLIVLIVFLLPWQTQLLFGQAMLGDGPLPMGEIGLFFVEAIIILLATRRLFIGWTPKQKTAPVLFLLFLFISAAWSFSPALTLIHAVHVGAALAFFWLLVTYRGQHTDLMWAFLAGLLPAITLAGWQVGVGSSPGSSLLGIAAREAEQLGDAVMWLDGQRVLRGYGTFSHPNILGGYVAIAIGIAVALWQKEDRSGQALLAILIPYLCAGLILSASRSAMLGILLACCLGFIWSAFKRTRQLPRISLLSALSVAACLLIGGVTLPLILERFDTSMITSASVQERLMQYHEAGQVAFANLYTGTGIGAYGVALAELLPGKDWWQYQPIHNAWLLSVIEIGPLGFGLLFVLLMQVRVHMRARWSYWNVALVATLAVIACFDHYLWSLWSGLALASFVLALILHTQTTDASLK